MRVDLDAIAQNWRAYDRASGAAETAAVVKADAYGLGARAVAPRLAQAGARTFFVASFMEAVDLRDAIGPGPAIYVLEGLNGPAGAFTAGDVRPVLNETAQIEAWRDAGGGAYALHLDTGMSRLGVPAAQWGQAAALAAPAPALVMSHLACASDPGDPHNDRQRLRFAQAAQLFPGAPLSLAASAGVACGAAYCFDLVRPGIGLYGDAGLDSLEGAGGPPLSPAFTLEAPILQVREIAPGDPVGYGATYIAQAQRRIAVVGAGYADGVLRSLSGKGYGFVNGTRCPILGRVSMDLVTLDVTDAQGVSPGTMAELIGPSARLGDVARLAGTAAYELLTNMRGLPRAYGALA